MCGQRSPLSVKMPSWTSSLGSRSVGSYVYLELCRAQMSCKPTCSLLSPATYEKIENAADHTEMAQNYRRLESSKAVWPLSWPVLFTPPRFSSSPDNCHWLEMLLTCAASRQSWHQYEVGPSRRDDLHQNTCSSCTSTSPRCHVKSRCKESTLDATHI
jgi:hypothetical protein